MTVGGLINDHPVPTTPDEQSAFNDAMQRYASIISRIAAQIAIDE